MPLKQFVFLSALRNQREQQQDLEQGVSVVYPNAKLDLGSHHVSVLPLLCMHMHIATTFPMIPQVMGEL